MIVGYRGLCDRCIAEHHEGCERMHWPNTEGAMGHCLGKRCIEEGGGIVSLPWLCVPRDADKAPS